MDASVAILFSPYATPSERLLLAGLPTEPASSVTEGPPGADSADARGDVRRTKRSMSLLPWPQR